MNADKAILNHTQWQFFATLTFKREEMSESRRMKLFFAWSRKISGWFSVYFPRLKWAVRLEAGEKGGRLHYHVLIAGLPENVLVQATCNSMEKLWKNSMGVGIAQVRRWEAGRDAVAYITKGGDYSLANANSYEARKFGGRCVVTVSESLLNIRNGDESRTRPHHDSKHKGLNSSQNQRLVTTNSGMRHIRKQSEDRLSSFCTPERSTGHVRGEVKGQGTDAIRRGRELLPAPVKIPSEIINWVATGNGQFLRA